MNRDEGLKHMEVQSAFASLLLQLPRLHSSHIDMASGMQACSGEAGPGPLARRDGGSHSSAFPASDPGRPSEVFVHRTPKHGQSGKEPELRAPPRGPFTLACTNQKPKPRLLPASGGRLQATDRPWFTLASTAPSGRRSKQQSSPPATQDAYTAERPPPNPVLRQWRAR